MLGAGLALALVLSVPPSAIQEMPKVRVYVGTFEAPGQFVEPGLKDRTDSAKDIAKSLRAIWGSRKLLEVVDERANADVVIEVVGRTVIQAGGQVTTVVPNGFGGFIATSRPQTGRMVFAWLRTGEYERALAGTGGLWSAAGRVLAQQVFAGSSRITPLSSSAAPS